MDAGHAVDGGPNVRESAPRSQDVRPTQSASIFECASVLVQVASVLKLLAGLPDAFAFCVGIIPAAAAPRGAAHAPDGAPKSAKTTASMVDVPLQVR